MFDRFYDSAVKQATHLCIGQPRLPRYRKPPKNFDGSQPHQFSSPRSFSRQQYFEACDLFIQQLNDRFEQKDIIKPVVAMESILLKSANGEEYGDELNSLKFSVLKDDLDYDKLGRHLSILASVVHEALPEVEKVTSIRTICVAMRAQTYRTLLSAVHELVQLSLTLPITSSTSERSFSALRRLLTYLRSTMTEKRLNNCLLRHVHKDLTKNLTYWKSLMISFQKMRNDGDTSVHLLRSSTSLTV